LEEKKGLQSLGVADQLSTLACIFIDKQGAYKTTTTLNPHMTNLTILLGYLPQTSKLSLGKWLIGALQTHQEAIGAHALVVMVAHFTWSIW
jgi:hypothetical protein